MTSHLVDKSPACRRAFLVLNYQFRKSMACGIDALFEFDRVSL